jgi:hypothetical protein
MPAVSGLIRTLDLTRTAQGGTTHSPVDIAVEHVLYADEMGDAVRERWRRCARVGRQNRSRRGPLRVRHRLARRGDAWRLGELASRRDRGDGHQGGAVPDQASRLGFRQHLHASGPSRLRGSRSSSSGAGVGSPAAPAGGSARLTFHTPMPPLARFCFKTRAVHVGVVGIAIQKVGVPKEWQSARATVPRTQEVGDADVLGASSVAAAC